MTPEIVVDTNVLAISERLEGGASDACVNACVQLAERITEGRAVVVVDDAGEILTEYLSALEQGKTGGVGVKLARLLRQRSGMPDVCKNVKINRLPDNSGSYFEVPESLRDFDVDDQKFLAAAKAADSSPKLFAGLDEEWWCRSADLATEGFDVQFVCHDDLLNIDCGCS